ncbi:MAG TPA: PD-(D/E)XK nuclease family protein [Acidimicrobiales bacterium]|nr:PD-(D/E)XK nuclease family protein [Acidimicrobiales bacterium]
MSLPLPTSLSPSKVTAFKECALAFRFSAIDRLPEPPSPWAAKGTLVHRALELLFWEFPAGARTPDVAADCLGRAWAGLCEHPEFADLGLSAEEQEAFVAEAAELLRRYFELEDPNGITVLATELLLEATLGDMTLRGIIDRLELDATGALVVTDYKTGRPPSEFRERSRMEGIHFYAYLCEQALGVRPARIQLLYLSEPVVISTVPSAQSIRGMQVKASAIWTAVERACQREDFRPQPSGLCPWCAYQAYCPAFGGNPADALAGVATVPTP